MSIGLALAGVGAMSLAIGRVSGLAISALIFLWYSPLPVRCGLDRSLIRPLLAFGLPLAGASIIVFLVGFLDQVVVGHLLGPVVLGYYVLAVNLAGWPVSIVSQPLRSVAPVIFARLQGDPGAMTRSFADVLRPLAGVALIGCGTMVVVAPDLVLAVYGDAWAPAGPILRWLAALAALRILFELAYDFLVVLGRSSAIFRIQVAWLVALVPAVLVGVHVGGAAGAAASLVVVALLVSCPLYAEELRRAGIGPRTILRQVALPLSIAAACGAAAVAVSAVLSGPWTTLAVVGLIAGGALAAFLTTVRADLAVFRGEAAR
jgi:PST family polysaccharide transporter